MRIHCGVVHTGTSGLPYPGERFRITLPQRHFAQRQHRGVSLSHYLVSRNPVQQPFTKKDTHEGCCNEMNTARLGNSTVLNSFIHSFIVRNLILTDIIHLVPILLTLNGVQLNFRPTVLSGGMSG